MASLNIDPAMQQFVEVDPKSEPSRQSYVKFVEGKSPDELRWWTKETVAVVTGANKGIGFEIVRQLASAGVTTILTARDESRGLAAADALKAEGLENVLFHALEITDPASASKLANWIKEKFGGVDILINNAGIGTRGFQPDYESAKKILNANYHGQKIVTSALLPLFKPSPAGARIIFVSSELGQLVSKMSMNGEEVDGRRNGEAGQGGTTPPASTESNESSTTSTENGEQLLPGLPNEITFDLITPKFSWRDFPLLASISRAWQRALQGGQVSEARIRSNSAETLVAISHMRFSEDTQAQDIHAICLYSLREERTFELPPIPDLPRGLPYSCQCISLDGKIYILGGTQVPYALLGRAEVYVLELAGGRTQWKPCASMHEPRFKLGCSAYDGKIYVFGGESLDAAISVSEVYDPKVDAWSVIKPIPALRVGHQVETVGRELFVHGGQHWVELDREGDFPYYIESPLSLEIYTPDEDHWRLIQPFRRNEMESVFVSQGKLHLICQLGIYVYATDDNSWTLLQLSSYEMIRPHDEIGFHAAVAADDELVVRVNSYSTAGQSSDSYLLQSRGFRSDQMEVIWEEVKCPLSFEDLALPRNCFLCTVRL